MINKLKRLLRRKVPGVIFMALMVGLITVPGAKAASIDLLTAGPAFYTVLGLGTNVITTSSSIQGTLVGNVGVVDSDNPPPHALLIATTGTITGTVFIQDLAQFNNITNIVPGGGVVIDAAKLDQAKTDALARSAFYAGQAATDPTTTIDDNTLIVGNGGLNVLNLTGGLILTGSETLTLQGTAADAFVINVPNNALFIMTGTSSIEVAGGVLPQNVLFNLLETDANYSVAGAEINGLVLAPNVLFTATGTIIGEIIASDITLHSNALVNNPFVPIPPTAVLLGSGLLGLGLLGGRKHWFRRN